MPPPIVPLLAFVESDFDDCAVEQLRSLAGELAVGLVDSWSAG